MRSRNDLASFSKASRCHRSRRCPCNVTKCHVPCNFNEQDPGGFKRVSHGSAKALT